MILCFGNAKPQVPAIFFAVYLRYAVRGERFRKLLRGKRVYPLVLFQPLFDLHEKGFADDFADRYRYDFFAYGNENPELVKAFHIV